MTQTDLAILFVADGARLEAQSWLLAGSLAQVHGPEVRRYAYAAPAWVPQVSATTRAIYEATGVELRALAEPPNWKKDYPHGNKIVAACDDRGAAVSVFLDTDMVCARPLTEFADLPAETVAAAPEGRATWGDENERWERAYAHFNLPFPTERIRLLRGNRQEFVPYYNAGLVAFAEARHADGRRFAEHWLDTALDFDRNCKIAQKRPWLDQIALPLTLARFGYKTQVLGESYNYSLSNRGEYADTPDAHVLHYHRNQFLAQAPQWPEICAGIFDKIPVSAHDAVKAYMDDAELPY